MSQRPKFEGRRRSCTKGRAAVWYVYILRSDTDGKLYVGSTADLKRRLREHNERECDSTRHRRPLELEASEVRRT